jgi:L-2-hydroxyglutarate oxidase LhgO
MDEVDAIVVGAGVVGLAVARALARGGRETLIFESHAQFGTEISSRNSEVIHAGIYYPHGSLRAQLCVAGRDRLYDFCERYGVGYRRCGKLIVAVNESQLAELEGIRSAAQANGVQLDMLSRAEVLAMEPALSCTGGLWSASTGIVDSHGYMLALLGAAEQHGATLICSSAVTGMRLESGRVLVSVNNEPPVLRTRLLVNCAGLQATRVARTIEGFPAGSIPTPYFAKGNYFALAAVRAPFQRLVYPVPEHGGLGVHLTLDLAGRARFGPDVQWLDCDPLDYTVDASRLPQFYQSIRQYWPGLPDGALIPAYCGIRPKITGPGEPPADFRIDGPEFHGVPGIINLFGIESPGLTASLAIADYVSRQCAG